MVNPNDVYFLSDRVFTRMFCTVRHLQVIHCHSISKWPFLMWMIKTCSPHVATYPAHPPVPTLLALVPLENKIRIISHLYRKLNLALIRRKYCYYHQHAVVPPCRWWRDLDRERAGDSEKAEESERTVWRELCRYSELWQQIYGMREWTLTRPIQAQA